jgi:hypothetical protein
MIILHPDGERAQVLTFDEFRKQLLKAYATHKVNEKIKAKNCEITLEDINFAVSHWMAELPGLFTKALDLKSNYVAISYSTYPRYFDEVPEFLANLFRKSYPSFYKLLQSMDIRVEHVTFEGDYPQVTISIEELKKFINTEDDLEEIDHE